MTPNVVFEVTLQADDNDGRSVDARFAMDENLTRSLISRKYAKSTRGIIQDIPASDSSETFQGLTYKPTGKISLQWWLRNGCQSFTETFYIVDSCGQGVNGFFRGDLEEQAGPRDESRKCRPLKMPRNTTEAQRQLEEDKAVVIQQRKADKEAEEKAILQKRQQLKAQTTRR